MRHRVALIPLFALLTSLAAGCGSDKTTQPVVYDESSLNAADSVLGVVLMNQLGTQPQRPADIDLSGPYGLYQTALADPKLTASNRLRARFGVAVLGMMMLTVDPEVNAAFDEWKAYLETHVPFEVTGSPIKTLGVPTGLTSGRQALRLPFDVVPLSLVAQTRTLGAPDPQISRVQAILRDRALPRLTEAIMQLDIVGADPTFQFIVTPEMQGDLDAEPVEIDRTDALALRAACHLLASATRIAVAYELNFPAYDGASLLAAIQPGSDWLSLRSDGGTQMRTARTDILSSLNDVEATISSLLSEQDDQDDDVIRVGPSGVARASLDSVTARIRQVRQALNSGYTLVADWDQSGSTPDVPLTINPRSLFDDPVQDWKALLPAYTGSIRERPFNVNWVYNSLPDSATLTITTTAFYVSPSSGEQEYPYGDAEIVSGLRDAVRARYSVVSALPGWGGTYYGGAFFDGTLAPGVHKVEFQVSESYTLATRTVQVPVITWEATQFSEWSWPDPSMNGLFPGITSTSQLLSTFGSTADNWQREVVLDWTGGRPSMSGTSSLRAALPSRSYAHRARRP
jgi:hypothetical protein